MASWLKSFLSETTYSSLLEEEDTTLFSLTLLYECELGPGLECGFYHELGGGTSGGIFPHFCAFGFSSFDEA